MISGLKLCPKCGSEIPADAPEGGCPACLLKNGIELLEDESAAGVRQAEINGEDDLGPDSPPSDARFGIYEIERRPDGSLYELGRGGMGVTYRAIDTSLQRGVALKIIKAGVARRSASARERFMREARLAAALRHENIATVYQFGIREDKGQYFYAMELIEGKTLEERVRRAGPLSVRTTIDIAQQITAALVVAERQGLLHRDLKPENLMLVSPDDEERGTAERSVPTVKIIDFGLAKALHASVDATSLTRGGFVGTPEFASPEQFEHSSLDVRSDIYSLGVTLWFALTGKTPFGGRDFEEIRRAQQSDVLPIEQLRAARVPSRLRSLLKSMLALEPAARPGTYELTAQLQRCAAEARGERRAGIGLAAAAILILGAAALSILWPLSTVHRRAAATQKPPLNLRVLEKSIAVLPFENRSEDKQNAYFADGMQGEILTDLAKMADLKVISRSSVIHYKSGLHRNLHEIGQQLGVAHVVEGSVQRSGNRVRVNAQLVDTRSDRHLWAQTYDRDLTDVFDIQGEIAKTIGYQLRAKLSSDEKSAIERQPTTDIKAFDLDTLAKNLLLTAFTREARARLLQAVDLLNQAIVRDLSFFDAYCQLAYAHDALYTLGLDHTAARLASAEAAIRAAFRLRPDAGEAHLARAWHLYWGYLDYDGALAEVKVARQTLPNDPQVVELQGFIERRQGRWEESTRDLERLIDLDPRNVDMLVQTALNYRWFRRYAEEKSLFNYVLTIEPNDTAINAEHAFVELDRKADIRPLHQMIDSIRATNPAAAPSIDDFRLICALAERDAAAAENVLITLGENAVRLVRPNNIIFPRSFVEGLIARMAKDDDKARTAFTAARAEQHKAIETQPNYGPPLSVLGLIDAALGRKEEALREGRRAVELLPVEKDAFQGPVILKYFAMIAAWAGDKDLACEQLATVIRGPSDLSYGQLKLMPWWDPLRGDPRFEKIVASLAPKEAAPNNR